MNYSYNVLEFDYVDLLVISADGFLIAVCIDKRQFVVCGLDDECSYFIVPKIF